MSSPDRRAVLLLPLLLAACGFTPAFGPGGSAAALTGRIATADPADPAAYHLVARLETRLGRAQAPVWRLDYTIATETREVGITPEGAVTRYHLTGRVDWRLVDLATGQETLAGRAESFTAFSATGSTIAGLAAEDDAQRRLMGILADQIATRLIAAGPAAAS